VAALPSAMTEHHLVKRMSKLMIELDVIELQLKKNRKLDGTAMVRITIKHTRIRKEIDVLYDAKLQLKGTG